MEKQQGLACVETSAGTAAVHTFCSANHPSSAVQTQFCPVGLKCNQGNNSPWYHTCKPPHLHAAGEEISHILHAAACTKTEQQSGHHGVTNGLLDPPQLCRTATE